MRRNIILLILVFFYVGALYADVAQDRYTFASTYQAQRFQILTQEIRCVVCQNQNIADSNAPLANDLREKIYVMIKDNQSDENIKAYLVKRYGEFILLKPRFNKLTWFLWAFPFLGLAFILFIFAKQTTKRNHPA